MNDSKKHTDKIATSILRGEYADYDKHWWHYDREYNMLLKAQTEAFKLANEAAEQQDKEAIDTVVAEVEKPLPTEQFAEIIERLWKDYRLVTNNEDSWCFKNWLVERVRIESTLLTEKCDVCGCHPSILIRTSFGTFCQEHAKY